MESVRIECSHLDALVGLDSRLQQTRRAGTQGRWHACMASSPRTVDHSQLDLRHPHWDNVRNEHHCGPPPAQYQRYYAALYYADWAALHQ